MKTEEKSLQYEEWIQRNGTRIRIIDMEDSHLINTINMLHRKAKRLADDANADQITLDPDIPYFEYEANSFLPKVYPALVYEIKKRGLVVPVL